MPSPSELLSTAILTRLSYYNLNAMVGLYREMGSATAIIEQRREIGKMYPALPARVVESLSDIEAVTRRAEDELAYCEHHGIQTLTMNDARYPARLRDCPDAPLMLFYKGNADLNARHIINIVGTRHITTYGDDLVRHLVADLRQLCPDLTIVSGLAYGVDVCAHRQALAHGMETIGVLAHGLDDLYPPRHRDTANEMVVHGGLLTEFMTHTNADKLNFVRRNRITAGICDACVLIESARKGGGLITARISREYHRDVFAFPGPVGATYSEGCNALIRDNGAMLLTSGHDLVEAMGWSHERTAQEARQAGIERSLFPDLTDDERRVADLLRQNNDLQANIISVRTGLPIGTVSALLFGLEMKGVIKPYAGGTYHLLS